MSDKRSPRWRTTDHAIASIFVIVSLILYAGFYFPDPVLLLFGEEFVQRALLAIRMIFPLGIIGVVCVFYAIRARRLTALQLAGILGSTALTLLLLYPVIDVYYDIETRRHRKIRKTGVHPYLQLYPRDLDIPADDAGSFRVFCLGGSTTEFRDEKKRDWPSLVERKLKERGDDLDVSVYNCGRQWYTTQHTLLNYVANLRQHRPDLVIVMHNVNDLLHNADFSHLSAGAFREDYGHFLGPVFRVLTRKSLLIHFPEMIPRLWYHRAPVPIEATEFPGLAPFERNLRSLIQLGRADATTVVLMTQPGLYREDLSETEIAQLYLYQWDAVGDGKRWSLETARRGFEQYNDRVRALAQEEGIPLIDLEQVIPKTTRYFVDDVHYTSEALDLISDHVAGELLRTEPLAAD